MRSRTVYGGREREWALAGPCNIHSLALSRHINAVIESGGGSPVTFTAPVVIDGIANTVKMTVNVHSYV